MTGAGAKDVLLDSGLDVAQLRLIWELSDIDKDGCLDAEEFAVCQCEEQGGTSVHRCACACVPTALPACCADLIKMAKGGRPLPATLPPNIVPPNKK